MKKNLRIICVSILTVIIFIGIYTQVYAPVVVEIDNVKCVSWDATYVSAEAFAEAYTKGEYDKDSVYIHSFDGKLPSENPDDYMNLYCTLNIKNRNLIDDFRVDAAVSELNAHEGNVLYSFPASDPVRTTVFKRTSSSATFIIDIYIGDMNEAQIKELAQGIKAKFVYSGKYMGLREKIISFENCEDKITVEFAE